VTLRHGGKEGEFSSNDWRYIPVNPLRGRSRFPMAPKVDHIRKGEVGRALLQEGYDAVGFFRSNHMNFQGLTICIAEKPDTGFKFLHKNAIRGPIGDLNARKLELMDLKHVPVVLDQEHLGHVRSLAVRTYWRVFILYC